MGENSQINLKLTKPVGACPKIPLAPSNLRPRVPVLSPPTHPKAWKRRRLSMEWAIFKHALRSGA
ncbi:MAG: hypothetical protein QXY40_10030 [Candidatus Methanomethylicia archaeon]